MKYSRRIYKLCEISNPLKSYREVFSSRVFESFVLFIHGLILSQRMVSCLSIANEFVYSKSQQALNYFLHAAKFDLAQLILTRLKIGLEFATKQISESQKYYFFIVDDFVIPKRKYKKTQGVGINYCSSTKTTKRSQCIVSSSFLIGNCHSVFKSLFYIGKKYISKKKFQTKTQLALKLFTKFEKFISQYKKFNQKCIALVDGGYTNSYIMQYVNNSSVFIGFIGRHHKGRNIYLDKETIKLNAYIARLTLNNFTKIKVNGNEKYVHEINCGVKGAKSLKLVVVIDDVNNPIISEARPLITNIKDLSAAEIVDFFSKRWKEETYHQILKDGFGAKTHKLRSLKSTAIFFETIAVAYTLCEIRRIKTRKNGIFDVKNQLVSITNKNFILNAKGNKIKLCNQDKVLLRFAA